MSIIFVLDKSNSNRIELIKRVNVNYKSTSWNLSDKDIADIKQYLIFDHDTALDMID